MRQTRRELLTSAFAAAAHAKAAGRPEPAVAVFSKPLQHLKIDELGSTLKRIGAGAVDLTVRPDGHVLPSQVSRDLPRAAEILAGHGVSIPMITTALTSASDPTARPILETAAKLRIPYFKLGYWRYKTADVAGTLKAVRKEVRGLVDLAAACGIQAGWHNHAGNYVGAPIWDAHSVISELDPKWIGFYWDTSHAFAEGGVGGWEIGLHLALPRVKMVATKDHTYERAGGKWVRKTCPLGTGVVDLRKCLSTILRSGFHGVISLHVEYPSEQPADDIARDLAVLRRELDLAAKSPKGSA